MLKKRTKWEITKTKSKKEQKENEKIEKKKRHLLLQRMKPSDLGHHLLCSITSLTGATQEEETPLLLLFGNKQLS